MRNSPRTFCLSIALLFSGGIVVHSRSLPQQPASRSAAGQSTISVTTELVVLPVSVTDKDGNFVSGLALPNFRVYEDGRLQTVTSFQQEDTPVTVGLIVDHSRSMGPKLRNVAAAVYAFARSSNPQDEMFVADFNDTVSLEPPSGAAFTNDPKILERAVSAVSARGKTALYDAVAEGIQHLQLGHLDKKSLVIVSDGGDNASVHNFSQILELARRYQVTIYAIGLIDSNEEENPKALLRLCKDTGGIAYFPGDGENVTDISKQIAHDLRDQYTLAFPPEKTNIAHPFRKIEVKIADYKRGKVRVRTRPGYFGTVQQKQSSAASERSAS
jgi:VWFA-related protein